VRQRKGTVLISLLVVPWIARRMRIPMPISGSDRLFWIQWIITHGSLRLCRRGSVVRSVESIQVRAVVGVLFLLRVQLRFLEVVMTENVNVSGRLIVIVIGVWCMRKVFF
jgi:hypothetical protein